MDEKTFVCECGFGPFDPAVAPAGAEVGGAGADAFSDEVAAAFTVGDAVGFPLALEA